MAKKPGSNVNPDPYLAMLDEWEDVSERLAVLKEREADLRRKLFTGAFPNPKEGTRHNKHVLPDGRVLVGDYCINRKIDEAALPAVLEAMKQAGDPNPERLVRYKPELAKREWNDLNDERKLMFSAAVIATPGMPGFEVKKAKKGA